jgi:hypothetical protein
MVYNIESCGKCGKSCPEKTKIPQLKKENEDFMKIGADFATPATTLDSIPRPLWHLWQILPRLL